MKRLALIVEDDPEIFEILKRELVPFGAASMVCSYEEALKWVSQHTTQKDVSEKIQDVFEGDALFFLDLEIPRGEEADEIPEKLGSLIAEGLVENFGIDPSRIFCTSSRPGALRLFPAGCRQVGKLDVVDVTRRFMEGEAP